MNLRIVGRQEPRVGGSQALTSRSGLLQAWGSWDPRPSMLGALHCLSPLDVSGTVGPTPGLVLQAPLWWVQ